MKTYLVTVEGIGVQVYSVEAESVGEAMSLWDTEGTLLSTEVVDAKDILDVVVDE